MAGVPILLWAAIALGAGGIAALRYAWSLPRRSPAANAAGWALLALSSLVAGVSDGAWGVAVAALGTTLVAIAVLAVAGIRAPAGRAKSSNRRVGMLPEGGEPRRLGRRAVTFLLTIVCGFAVSVALALAIRGLGGVLGWYEANANVVALFSVPLTWAILVFTLLMQRTRRSQVATLLICGLPVLPALLSGAAL